MAEVTISKAIGKFPDSFDSASAFSQAIVSLGRKNLSILLLTRINQAEFADI